MKVILLQELKGRGGEGDVIEVARGFAVNYLLPRKVAVEATSGNLKQLEQRRHNIEKRETKRITDADSLRSALDGTSVTISAKVGEEGRLFGSVTSSMVEDAIREQLGVEVDRRKIETHGHIKDVGPHVVDIAVYRDIKAQVTVDVVAEGAPVEQPVAAAAEPVVVEEGAAFVELAEPSTEEPTEENVEAEEAPVEAAEGEEAAE